MAPAPDRLRLAAIRREARARYLDPEDAVRLVRSLDTTWLQFLAQERAKQDQAQARRNASRTRGAPPDPGDAA